MSGALIAAVGVVIGALLAYFGVVRRASGKIGTSEAESLWEESRAIRMWATRRIRELEVKLEKLEGEHERCLNENIKLTKRVAELEFLQQGSKGDGR